MANATDHDHAARVAELVHAGELEAAIALARDLHPAELAAALTGIDTHVRDLIVERCDPAELAAALGYLESHYRDGLLTGLPVQRISEVLSAVPDNVATDIVQALPAELRPRVIDAVSPAVREAIGGLLEHATDTAGGRMTGQRIAVHPHQTAGEVIAYLRSLRPDTGHAFYVYVTDEDGRLSGVLNLRTLLIAPPDVAVGEIAEREIVSVTARTDQEEAARVLKRYHLLAIPVVDGHGRLIGSLTADDLINVLEDEATEDMFRMAGVNAEEDLRGVLRSVRFRLPWLSVNLVTVLAAAFVVSLFQDTLERVIVLAVFLPVVAGMGGNAGIQTLTIVIRSLALGRLTLRDSGQVVLHELGAGLLMGTVTGAAVAVIAWLWQDNPWLGAVVGAALVANVLVGVLAGVLLPLGLHRLKRDPALSAGIWLTTATDVLGFLAFLGLATLLIARIE
ncbi:MAG: magnesium transporter [Dehalococcoidia bacterium]